MSGTVTKTAWDGYSLNRRTDWNHDAIQADRVKLAEQQLEIGALRQEIAGLKSALKQACS